jgi:phenylacetate-CoA ligase
MLSRVTGCCLRHCMDKMAIYNRLPIFMQNWACSLEGAHIVTTRFGSSFRRLLQDYEMRVRWSPEQIAAYRDERLRIMVKHCYETVPYYKNVFDEGGINPVSIKGLEDLPKLPLLTKKEVNRAPDQFLSSAYVGKRIKHHTSGTTGSGFVFYTSPEAISEQWACWWRFRRSLGIEFGTPQAMFGTQKVVPITQTTPPYWRENKPSSQVYFSAFHEREENLAEYCREIQRRHIPWIHGYPSLLTPLASFAEKNGMLFPDIRFVTTGAENLYEHQAELIERAFGIRPHQHYGMCEGVANFSQDDKYRMFVDEDYAAVEFIDERRVVGTTLTNMAMPLLRWDTGDVAEVKTLPDGKREIVSLDGRTEDSVLLPDGTTVGKLDHVFKDTVHIAEAQIHQNSDLSITVYAVKTQEDVSADERKALQQFEASFTCAVPINFKYVAEIPRANSGKLRFVVSEARRGC